MTSTCTVLPAEWEPQAGVMLTWPRDPEPWAGDLDAVERCFVTLARAIGRREALLIAAADDDHCRRIRHRLGTPGPWDIHCHVAPADDIWARDHGPVTVYRDGSPVLLDFRFNGWGRKYPHAHDDALSGRLHGAGAFGATPMERVDLVLEGGSIDSDGQGTLLTTRRCLLSPRRNPLGAQALEARLRDLLGVERILWLAHGGLLGDDTDGHVDTLARFCDPGTIAYQACDDPVDPHHGELQAMATELGALRTATGEHYRLVPLPLPAPRRDAGGRRLPASYANFLVIDGAVLVPTYDDPADAGALERLASCFSQREIVPVPCLPLIGQFGSLHCVTMQLPAGVELGRR